VVGLSVCGIHGVHPANKRLNVSTEVIVRRIFNPTKRRHIAPLSAVGLTAGEEMRRAIEGRELAPRPVPLGFHSTCSARRCSAVCDARHDLSLSEMREASSVNNAGVVTHLAPVNK